MPSCRQELTLKQFKHQETKESSWVLMQANENIIDQGRGEFFFNQGRSYTMDGTRYIVSGTSFGLQGLMNVRETKFSTFLNTIHGGEITELLKSDRSV